MQDRKLEPHPRTLDSGERVVMTTNCGSYVTWGGRHFRVPNNAGLKVLQDKWFQDITESHKRVTKRLNS